MHRNKLFCAMLLLFFGLRLLVLLYEPKAAYSGSSEAFRATAGFDLMTERRFHIFDYTFHHNEGGSLVASLLTAAVFKIAGVSLFSLHLVALMFSLLAFVIGFFLLKRFVGLKEANVFVFLFVFAPQTYVKLSLTNWCGYLESIVFTLLMAYFIAEIYTGSKRPDHARTGPHVCLLGFVCGFSIWYSYFNLIGAVTCVACFFLMGGGLLSPRKAFYFLAGCLAGASLIIFYNLHYAHGGVGLVHDKTLMGHFSGIDMGSRLRKFLDLLLMDFPMSLAHKNVPALSRETIGYLNYGIFVVLSIVAVSLKLKTMKSAGSLVSVLKRNPVVTFCFLYLLIFTAAYVASDFNVERDNVCNGYRYIAAILPVMWILLSVFVVFLLTRNRAYSKLAYLMFAVAAVNLAGLYPLTDRSAFLKTLGISPVSYRSLGMSVASKFGNDLDKCISYADKLNPIEKAAFFWGLGDEIGRRHVHGLNRSHAEVAKIPERYRIPFTIAMGGGIWLGSEETRQTFEIFNQGDQRYLPYEYLGLGAYVTSETPQHFKEVSEAVEGSPYACFFYQGVGAATFFSAIPDIKKCNDDLIGNSGIGSDDKACCFYGLSWALLDEDIKDWQSLRVLLRNSYRQIDEKYRQPFLQGLEQNTKMVQQILAADDEVPIARS